MKQLQQLVPPSEELHPRLKIGAKSKIAIRVPGLAHEIEPIAPFLDGNHDLDDIAQRSGLPLSRVEWLINELYQQRLLDVREGIVQVRDRHMTKVKARALRSKRSVPDASYVHLQKKIAPELSLLAWREGVDDGGVEMLSARQRCEIEVTGISRMLPTVIAILRASGVTQTHAVISARPERDVVDVDDLASGIFDLSDVGGQYFARLNERLKSYSLFSQALEVENPPFLHLHFGTPSLEECSQWIQRGESYLVIHEPRAGEIAIGPLVVDRNTPCIRCSELSARDRGEINDGLNGYDIPVAQAHIVAGFIADQVLRFIDTGSSEVVSAEIVLDFLNPLLPHYRKLQRHPRCGCAFQR